MMNGAEQSKDGFCHSAVLPVKRNGLAAEYRKHELDKQLQVPSWQSLFKKI